MQRDDAEELRQHWSNKKCDHPKLQQEYENTAATGNLVCAVCGALFTESEFEALIATRIKSAHNHDPSELN